MTVPQNFILAATGVIVLLATATAYPSTIPKRLAIDLEPVATGLTAPNWGATVPGCPGLADRLVVTDQDGILWAIDLATGEKSVLLDVSDRLVSLGVAGPGTFDERGLLGVALHPEYADNGLLYTYTSEPVDGAAEFSTMPAGETANHQSVIREWQVIEPCNPDSVVDPETTREVLRIDQPQFNHDAGALVFGPDGRLFISLGDGGAADDQGVGHVAGGNGQDPGNILGSILRLDPQGSDSGNGQYGIPADNPFVGVPEVLPEIYAYGLRNPFRFSFDSNTGDMYIADVGQNDIEEVNLGVAGGNFGWNIKEGSLCFDPNGDEPGFVFVCGPDDDTASLTDPIAEYDHSEGIAVVGGFVYRGTAIPPLKGRYVFGDFFHPASLSGRLFYLENNAEIVEFNLGEQAVLGMSVLGFGQDAAGEIYVMASLTGTPFGETGVVLRTGFAQPSGDNRFRAQLNGSNEVPGVDVQGQGQALVEAANGSMEIALIVANLEDIVASHIHCAAEGVNGPIGLTLFAGGPVSDSGILVGDTFSAPDAGNTCGCDDIEDAVSAMRAGGAYVNVHTLAHPPGAIRGQLK